MESFSSIPYPESVPTIYSVSEPHRGHAVILNNYKFRNLTTLKGGEYDSQRLKRTFVNLQFKVDVHENQSAANMKKTIQHYSTLDHGKYSCFVCVLSSHGCQSEIHGSDDEAVPIYELIEVLLSCDSLLGKPKLFFIDACRNSSKDTFVVDFLPQYSDYFICFSTLAGNNAYMMKDLKWKGSQFWKVFCDTFRKYGNNHDLSELIRKLKPTVLKISKNSQRVEIRESLSKNVVFTPGWWVCERCHSINNTNTCKGQDCLENKDSGREWDTEEFLQMLRDFKGDLYTFISLTNEVIQELDQLSEDLNEHFRKINIAKVSGAIVGGVLTAVGRILNPFTFRGSLVLSIVGDALAGAGGVTVGGSALGINRRKTAEYLLCKYSDMSTKIKNKCFFISMMLETYGEIEIVFPQWLQFWTKAVRGTDNCSDWKDLLNILNTTFSISAAGVKTVLVGSAALRIAGAGASVGLHIAGGVAGILFTPLDIYTLVDSAIVIHQQNPHQVSQNIKSLADKLKTVCPTYMDVDKMIDNTLAKL